MSTIATREERLDYIVETIKDGSFKSKDVAESLGISLATLKRDLTTLSLANILRSNLTESMDKVLNGLGSMT